MDNKSLGVGLALAMALSMNGHAKAETIDLTLRCRGTEVVLYTSKPTYITDPPKMRSVDFSVSIQQINNIFISTDGDVVVTSAITFVGEGKSIQNNSDYNSWNIKNTVIFSDGKLEQTFYINRLSGRLSYLGEWNGGAIISTKIEAECSKLSPEARKF